MYEENLLLLKLNFGRIYRKRSIKRIIVDFLNILKSLSLSIHSNESGNFWLLQSRRRQRN